MRPMTIVRTSISGALGALVFSCCFLVTPARSETFRVGRLLCASNARVGLILGSSQSLRCTFYRARGNDQFIYQGRIRRIGLDLGVTSPGTLSWAVLAKNSNIGPATLRGRYVGAAGNLAFGPGLGANVLIGGSRRSVMLQPVSLEFSVGLNVAAGVAELTLGPRGRR